MEFVCDNVTILEAWNVASSRLMEFVVVKCWLMVQQRCKCVILAPLHTTSCQLKLIIDNILLVLLFVTLVTYGAAL